MLGLEEQRIVKIVADNNFIVYLVVVCLITDLVTCIFYEYYSDCKQIQQLALLLVYILPSFCLHLARSCPLPELYDTY